MSVISVAVTLTPIAFDVEIPIIGSINSFSVRNFSETEYIVVQYANYGNTGPLLVEPGGSSNVNFGQRIPSDKCILSVRNVGPIAGIFPANGQRQTFETVAPVANVNVLITSIQAGNP